jgi:hypothetical protein
MSEKRVVQIFGGAPLSKEDEVIIEKYVKGFVADLKEEIREGISSDSPKAPGKG